MIVIQFAWDQTTAKLLNVTDYQIVPILTYVLTDYQIVLILTYVLTGNFLLLLLYLGLYNRQRSIPFDYLLQGY